MAPPRPTITPNVGVPKASFRKIPPEQKEFCGVDDRTAHKFGYNEVLVTFERPEHYIRYVEPAEPDLSSQVEYDMDEQDDEWLNMINNKRSVLQEGAVAAEVFEVIVDRLEKEWFDLMKRIPKPDQALPSEDSTCAVCDDGEGENSNAIVFCDGCNLAVHQDCYGVPYIPEGQWLCRKCSLSPESRVECILCPNDGGAFKQTSTGKWAHLLCAIWVPECVLGNPTLMEPIEHSDKIPKQRWKLVCSICKVKQGACIQCNKNTCVTAFHVSCARRQKLLSPMKSHGEGELQAFCEKHLPAEMRVNRVVPPSPLPSAPASPVRSPKKATRAQVQPTGPPLVPNMIVEKITDYIQRFKFQKKSQFILAVCRYWSLKREARRGAPLLKRLHLEPWSTSTASKLQTEEAKLKYLDNLYRLRTDLEQIRNIAELVKEREKKKLHQAQATETFVTAYLIPFDSELKKAYDQIIFQDQRHYFMHPVSRIDVPDYHTTISKPMHWLGIYDKIEKHEYLDTQAFIDDIHLVLDNAMMYNKKDTIYYKTAARIKNNSAPILKALQEGVKEKLAVWKAFEPWEEEFLVQETSNNPGPVEGETSEGTNVALTNAQLAEDDVTIEPIVSQPNGDIEPLALLNGSASVDEEIVPETPDEELAKRPELPIDELHTVPELQSPNDAPPPITPAAPSIPSVGDLEPFPPMLRLLQDAPAISDDIPYILSTDPLASFFEYERSVPKPPPPPPPPAPKRSHKAKKKDPAERKPTSPRLTRATAQMEQLSLQNVSPQRVVLLVRNPEESQANRPDVQESPNLEVEHASVPAPVVKAGTKRKRQPSEGWGQVVEDVDRQASFKLFESGWVLPPGSTRIRKKPQWPSGSTPRSSKEPKRARTSASATASRQTSQMPREESTNPAESVETQASNTMPLAEDIEPTVSAPDSAHSALPHSLPQAVEPKTTAKRAGGSRPRNKNDDNSSDLSELSEVDEARVEETRVEEVRVEEVRIDEAKADEVKGDEIMMGDAMVDEPQSDAPVNLTDDPSGIHRDAKGEPIHYEPGVLVWAKQAGFPWYPASIVDQQDEFIPLKVRNIGTKEKGKWKGPGQLYLAHFYDKHRMWTWCPLSKLAALGEDPEIDQKYLHQSGKGVKKGEIQHAYDEAMRDMETPDEAAEIEQAAQTLETEQAAQTDQAEHVNQAEQMEQMEQTEASATEMAI